MTKQTRSDDYIDGLQVAYRLVYQLSQNSVGQAMVAYSMSLNAIDKAINDAVSDQEKKIILI